jgi:hypothetical protein
LCNTHFLNFSIYFAGAQQQQQNGVDLSQMHPDERAHIEDSMANANQMQPQQQQQMDPMMDPHQQQLQQQQPPMQQ